MRRAPAGRSGSPAASESRRSSAGSAHSMAAYRIASTSSTRRTANRRSRTRSGRLQIATRLLQAHFVSTRASTAGSPRSASSTSSRVMLATCRSSCVARRGCCGASRRSYASLVSPPDTSTASISTGAEAREQPDIEQLPAVDAHVPLLSVPHARCRRAMNCGGVASSF